MTTEYPTLLHRWFDEVWNQKNTGTIREILTEDSVIHGLSGPGGPPARGFADFEEFHRQLLTTFPDLHVVVEDVVESEGKLAGRFSVTGTQRGPLQGMPATGKKVRFTGSGMANVENGKFVEVWNEVDFSKMQYDLAPDTPDVE